MSAFDRVIGELRGEARLDGHGEITLDGRQARAKLRAYQLADPRAYVLLLVQSAALRGASRIDLEISSKTATIAFDGHPVSAADLEGLYTSIFERPRDRLHRARQSLDLALNGALSLAPRRLEIVAGDGGGLGVWAELEDDGRDRIERRHVVGGGTQITVHERLGVHLIDRAMVYNGIAELLHLRRAARLAPLDVRVNGEALSRRRVEPGELLAAGVALSLGETRLLAGFAHDRDFVHDHFVPPAEQAAVDLLVGGIWLGRIGLEGVTPHLRVVVDDPRLRTDLSLTRVVEDELYWTVVAKAWRAAAGAFVRLLGWPEEWRPAWAEAALRGFLLRWPGDLVRDLQRDPELALLLPILRWPRVGGGWRSAAAILAEGGPVPFVRRPIPAHAAVAGLAAAIVCEDVESVALLRRIAGGREDPVDFAAELAEHRAHNLRLWRQRPHVTRSGDELLAWEAIVGPGIGGEVGLRRRGGPTEIDVVVDDHVIATLRAALPLGGVRAAITGAFEARPSFDGVYADRRFAAAIVGLLRALDRMVRFLLDPASQSAWRTLEVLEHERVAYLELLVDAGARRLLLRSLGVDEATAAAVEAGEVGVLPGLDLDGPAPHPIAALPLFPEVGGGGRSLAELIARHRAGASIDHVSERAMTIDELDPGCLRLDRWRRGILAALLGPDALVERSGLPAWALDARRPPRRRALAWARAPLLEVSRAVDGVDVRAAIMAEGTGDVVVLKEGFEILRASLAVPGLAVIASDDLATIDGVDLSLLSSARTEALIDAVVGGLDLLVARAIAAAPGGPRPLIALLLRLLREVYRTPRQLQEHLRLLSLEVDPELVQARLQADILSTGELRLSHHTRPFAADVMSGLRGRLCRRLGALIEAPLFPTIGGEVIGLAALLRSAAAPRGGRRGGTAPLHGVIRYALVAPGSFPELGGPPVLALQLSELREAIVPLFGADALEERGLGTLAALAARPRRAPAAASTAASRAAVRPAPTTTPVARPRPARAPEPAAVEALTDELVDFLEVEVEASPATTRDADARRLEFDALLEVEEAPADPSRAGDEALIDAAIDGAHLWLAADHLEGLRVEPGDRRRPSPLPGIVRLAGGHRDLDPARVGPALVALHHRLLQRVIAAGREREAAAAEYLVELCLRLHARPLAELAELGVDRLFRALVDAPLLALANGRVISCACALRERPPALLARLGGDPGPQTPEAALLEAIRDELRVVRGRRDALVGEPILARLAVGDDDDERAAVVAQGDVFVIRRGHPVVVAALAAALAGPDRAILVSMLASSVYTVVNAALEAISDEDEDEFHRLHARHLASGGRALA